MTKNNLNIQEVFSEAWVKTKKNFWFLLLLVIATMFISAVVEDYELLGVLIGIPLGISILTVSIVIANNHTPKYSDIFKSFDTYKITLNYVIASIIYFAIVAVGLLALIIPGIYLFIRLQFYKFLIIEDENKNPIDAIKESYKITEGNFWDLLFFMLVIVIMNLIAVIPLGLGLIITIPLTIVASAVLYKKIHTHNHTVHKISGSVHVN